MIIPDGAGPRLSPGRQWDRATADHWHVRRASWLTTLPAAEAAAVRRGSTPVVLGRGDMVFAPTRDPGHVYLLEEGIVRLFRLSEDGREVTLGYVRPGELFGEVSVVTERPRESFAQCRGPARILRVPRTLFLQVVQAGPASLFEVTKRLGDRLLRCESRIEDLAFRDVRSRLALLLVRLLEQHGGGASRPGAIGLRLSQEEIGQLIGATRQTVNAALRELLDTKLVTRERGSLVVVDPAGLRALAGATELPAR